jgi:hypothetical protein
MKRRLAEHEQLERMGTYALCIMTGIQNAQASPAPCLRFISCRRPADHFWTVLAGLHSPKEGRVQRRFGPGEPRGRGSRRTGSLRAHGRYIRIDLPDAILGDQMLMPAKRIAAML